MMFDTLLVVCPEHVDTLMTTGDYSKADLRRRDPGGHEPPLT